MSTFMEERCLWKCWSAKWLKVRSCCTSSPLEEHFCTLTYERRPYGVGLLIGGVDVCFFLLFHRSPKALISSIRLPLASTWNTEPARSALAARARKRLWLVVFWTRKRTLWRWATIVGSEAGFERSDDRRADSHRAGRVEGLRAGRFGREKKGLQCRNWRRKTARWLSWEWICRSASWAKRRSRPMWMLWHSGLFVWKALGAEKDGWDELGLWWIEKELMNWKKRSGALLIHVKRGMGEIEDCSQFHCDVWSFKKKRYFSF